jgi:transposase InsO family protein
MTANEAEWGPMAPTLTRNLWRNRRAAAAAGKRDQQSPPTGWPRLCWSGDPGARSLRELRQAHRRCLNSSDLALEEIAPSIGSVGECVPPGPFHEQPLRTIADVEYATRAWVNWWNTRHLHSSLGMLTPDEYEQAQYAASAESRNPYAGGSEPVTVHTKPCPFARHASA